MFIGDSAYFGLKDVGAAALPRTARGVPTIAFCLYQLQFACVAVFIIFGSAAGRIRTLPSILFVFLWTTLVYDVTAYWTWSARGWLRNLSCLETTAPAETPCDIGAYDFAGGGPVHIASGFAGLAYCLMVGKRKTNESERPHNLISVSLGTALLWFGWFGFNGGAAGQATPRAAMASVVTTISAAFAGFTWSLIDYFELERFSVVGVCSGIVSGLVVITPSAGYVAPWAAAVIGIIGGISCNLSCRLKKALKYDDTLDGFGLHGVGGFLGCVLTGIFHQKQSRPDCVYHS